MQIFLGEGVTEYWHGKWVKNGCSICLQSAEEGAQTSIHVAVSKELEDVSGEYFSECRISKPAHYALDDDVAKKLFELSETYANYDLLAASK